jgi:CTP:molybdopterin cytidylyltransferase MocA
MVTLMNENTGAAAAGTPDTGAVVVAAGLSSRMGRYKPLMEIDGLTIAQRVTGALAAAGANPIVVVTGHNAAGLEAHLHDCFVKDSRCAKAPQIWSGELYAAGRTGLIFVRNADYATTTMYESARIGLSHIADKCARTFFCPIDVPLFSAATARTLMQSDAKIAKPVYEGREGHPILISADLIPQLTGPESAGDAGGLKAALDRFADMTELVEVDDEGVLYDADTPEDIRRLRDLITKRGE